MDLGAYAQIDNLKEIAEKNGIVVPRLRGYRLMSKEKPISEEEIKQVIKDETCSLYEMAVCSVPIFRPNSGCSEFSYRTNKLERKYLIKETVFYTSSDKEERSYKKTVGIRWNLIHGKNRKALKFALKKLRNRIKKQYEVYNKYCGRSDILYIHARIGSKNWEFYGGKEIEKQPWFIEKVDDSYDRTYCDIYAKINI